MKQDEADHEHCRYPVGNPQPGRWPRHRPRHRFTPEHDIDTRRQPKDDPHEFVAYMQMQKPRATPMSTKNGGTPMLR